MNITVITGTGTGVGKTVVTAGLAALARERGQRVAVVKPAQTGAEPGEPGDLDVVRRLSGVDDLHEYGRFPDPLAPAAAARHAGMVPVDLYASAARVRALASDRDLVLVEGAGGLLVRYDERGVTIADLAAELSAPVLVVASPGLGTLNATALTLEALERRGLALAGVVMGTWPDDPDLATRSNVTDLETIIGRPPVGAMPEHAGRLPRPDFVAVARRGLVEWEHAAREVAPTRQTRRSGEPWRARPAR